ncbi:TPA: DUF5072 family protein [Streptococcus pyogenes]|nr:DUF5072 family protein [Streptococcus pyogenes]
MLKKLGLVDLHASIKQKIEDKTGLMAYDHVSEDMPSPFYFIEVVDKRPEDTKVMWCEVFTVWIHAIAEAGKSKIAIYDMIEKLEEALTEELVLPEEIDILRQSEVGMQSLQEDETGEMHAIVAYEIKVSYGFKVKV